MVAWSSPRTETQAGGSTRHGPDAPERVKAQAIILFWKNVAKGAAKMVAYARAANITNNSVPSVRLWVRVENDDGMDALESKRDNCGAITRFSPSKKRCIDELMEECEGEPTERQVQEALGLLPAALADLFLLFG